MPVFLSNQRCGTLSAREQGLYTRFEARADIQDLLRLCAEFEGGEMSLGVLVPRESCMGLVMTVPTRCLPAGRLLRGRLQGQSSGWKPFSGGTIGPHRLPPGRRQGKSFRFPWKPGDALPCDALLCFFSFVEENGETWLELKLGDDGIPEV